MISKGCQNIFLAGLIGAILIDVFCVNRCALDFGPSSLKRQAGRLEMEVYVQRFISLFENPGRIHGFWCSTFNLLEPELGSHGVAVSSHYVGLPPWLHPAWFFFSRSFWCSGCIADPKECS